MYSYGPPHIAKQKQDDQLEHTYSSYVRIRDVALKTSQKRWMKGRSGERGSGISVLAARCDDDDDEDREENHMTKEISRSVVANVEDCLNSRRINTLTFGLIYMRTYRTFLHTPVMFLKI